MAVVFRKVSCHPLVEIDATAPDGAIVGVVGEDGAGKSTLLRLAAGLQQPVAGEILASEPRRWLGPTSALRLAPVQTLALWHALALHDEVVRRRALLGLERLRRAGATILIASHELDWLAEVADEIWWLQEGRLRLCGAPAAVLPEYRRHLARRLREWGQGGSGPLLPSFRRGDGRAELVALETLDQQGRPARVWKSGETVGVAVTVRFHAPVESPVVGILIRTRIGVEVYGTNTELEGVRLGPCSGGQQLRVVFRFPCYLCPQDYTITAASHDPDGVWHDWVEDALLVSVVDDRYTAGVANLRATVSVERC